MAGGYPELPGRMTLTNTLEAATRSRADWLAQLTETDAVRLFHGATEGRPGLTIDRYGDVGLIQTFREPLDPEDHTVIEAWLLDQAGVESIVWNHRGAPFSGVPEPQPAALAPRVVHEHGLRFAFEARHRGQDPWLFLDFRAGRRQVRAHAAGRTVLNLFAYTCGVGVAALAGGARSVWNVDHASSALDVGRRNAGLNEQDLDAFDVVQADVIPTLRQLASLKVRGRAARRKYPRFSARTFGLVVLDPPTWSKGPFGAVDLVRDYQGLFKPALLATAPGGHMLATNHVSTVSWEDWTGALTRCAAKAGRPLQALERILPDPDFPSPDGRPPLKMAWITA